MEALSLLELNALVRRSLEQCLPDEYWVGDPARLRLKSLFATADDDLEVRCEEICVMWPVCGAICGLK